MKDCYNDSIMIDQKDKRKILAMNNRITKVSKSILHGFFEGFCLIINDNIIYLVGDEEEILYQKVQF